MNKIKFYWSFIIPTICLVILAFVYINTSSNVKQVAAETKMIVANNNTTIREIERKKDNLSNAYIYNDIVKNNYDIKQKKATLTKNVNAAFDMVFNHVKNRADFKNVKAKLPQLVGKDLSKELLTFSKPTIDTQGKEVFPFDKLSYINIEYWIW